jgi:hypothetical protein
MMLHEFSGREEPKPITRDDDERRKCMCQIDTPEDSPLSSMLPPPQPHQRRRPLADSSSIPRESDEEVDVDVNVLNDESD